jgi:hypothetical protein
MGLIRPKTMANDAYLFKNLTESGLRRGPGPDPPNKNL